MGPSLSALLEDARAPLTLDRGTIGDFSKFDPRVGRAQSVDLGEQLCYGILGHNARATAALPRSDSLSQFSQALVGHTPTVDRAAPGRSEQTSG